MRRYVLGKLRVRAFFAISLAFAAAMVVVTTPAYTLRSQIFAHDRVIVPVARVDKLPSGWRQFTNAPALLDRRGTQASTTITSWPYRPNSSGPVGSMPPQGILITINLTRLAWAGNRHPNLCKQTPRWPGHPPRTPPLELASTPAPGGMDGEPGVLEYRTFGRFGNEYNFEVRADIKTRYPQALWRKAAAVVKQLKLPRWPHPSSC